MVVVGAWTWRQIEQRLHAEFQSCEGVPGGRGFTYF
jgi:hypothetical protein